MTLSTSALRSAWAPACTPKGPVFLDAYKALDAVFEAHGYRPSAPDCGAYNCRKVYDTDGSVTATEQVAVPVVQATNDERIAELETTVAALLTIIEGGA